MDLILKPTELCNFACTFCSSTGLTEDKASKLSLDQVFQFLKRFPETNTIIVNGGDPLIMSPEYYWEILDYLKLNNLSTTLSFTTNLWDFYKKPDKWTELFRQPNVGVSTSFNYGSTRRISKDKVLTEEIFWEISNLFLEKVGYRPDFLCVINDENEDTALDNVRLAQRMGVECKLNYAMASGRQSKPYQLSKIYKIYLDIISAGLTEWEFNTKEMIKGISHQSTICPRNRSCDSGIRCLQPDGDYYSCGAFGDDREYPIDFEEEMKSPIKITPLENEPFLAALKPDCFGCMMFSLCNGCKKTVSDLKHADMVESHCHLMKKLEGAICDLPLKFNSLKKSKYNHETRYRAVD
jgi:radical SAM protein with 4Fe4S-binding SPASM domain